VTSGPNARIFDQMAAPVPETTDGSLYIYIYIYIYIYLFTNCNWAYARWQCLDKMNKTQTTEQTNTQHLKPITQNVIAQNTGYRKTRLHITEYGIRHTENSYCMTEMLTAK
jgi:hypothetical protein